MTSIAIIGRPNVGKSTLFNRLVGKAQALVDDMPGVTRDRKAGRGQLGNDQFDIIDTPGLEEADEASITGLMTHTALAVFEQVDVLLFVVDAIAGATPQDTHFARLAARSGKPVVLVANKAEGKKSDAGFLDLYSLGFGEPVAVSAAHGLGMADLHAALSPYFDGIVPDAKEPPIRITICGRPNVGKSTLMNSLLGEERVLTGDMAGITRDAIRESFTYDGTDYMLIDTAGMRRKARIDTKLERRSVQESIDAIRYAQIVIMVVDATQPLEKQDTTLLSLIEREGRACLIALNKWDAVPRNKQAEFLEEIHYQLAKGVPQLKQITVCPIIALRGYGLKKMMQEVAKSYERWNTRLPTSELNRWLEGALEQYTPPLVNGRRFKMRYVTQHSNRPPSFVLFSNVENADAPDNYMRYLVNNLRETFDLPGIPIRLHTKTGDNPYANKN